MLDLDSAEQAVFDYVKRANERSKAAKAAESLKNAGLIAEEEKRSKEEEKRSQAKIKAKATRDKNRLAKEGKVTKDSTFELILFHLIYSTGPIRRTQKRRSTEKSFGRT